MQHYHREHKQCGNPDTTRNADPVCRFVSNFRVKPGDRGARGGCAKPESGQPNWRKADPPAVPHSRGREVAEVKPWQRDCHFPEAGAAPCFERLLLALGFQRAIREGFEAQPCIVGHRLVVAAVAVCEGESPGGGLEVSADDFAAYRGRNLRVEV